MKQLSEYRVILASQSPRRRELLQRITDTFEIIPAEGEEKIRETQPDLLVQMLSRQKAEEVFRKCSAQDADISGRTIPDADRTLYGQSTLSGRPLLVIGADTVVAAGGQILGKPKNIEDASRMLKLLSGRTHAVYTGVTLMTAEETRTFFEKTEVTCYPISDAEISAYITTGSPMDKAGGYGIQDSFSRHIKGISGDYTNVVGFPVGRVYQELKEGVL